MTNAWSLAASILNGTFDKDYPIVNKKETEHSDYYYDYNRNDPNAKNPFTDPKDKERAEKVVNGDIDLDSIHQTEEQYNNATGEGAMDYLDLEIGN